MKKVSVNGEAYAYQITRKDTNLPYLLMLHGFMGDHRAFEHLMEGLSKFCNPITVDLLGFGQSSKPEYPDRYCEDQQVSDLMELITYIDIPAPYLFGYSMGGRLALHIALENKQHFRGLILESTNCGIPDSDKRTERRQTDTQRAETIRQNFGEFLHDWEKLELFDSPVPTDQSLVDKYRQIQSEQNPKALYNSLIGFGTGTMTPVCDQLNELDLPVLLLAGSADQKYQQINKNLMNILPNATFASIPAGHRTHLDNPTEFVAAIKQFLN